MEQLQSICLKSIHIFEHDEKENIGCFCLCANTPVKVYHPRRIPFNWDQYHKDQLNFFQEVSNSPNFLTGGILFSYFEDNCSLPLQTRSVLYQIRQPLVSHALLKRENESTEFVVFSPDFMFIRYRGNLNKPIKFC
jgi:hypothetical protein